MRVLNIDFFLNKFIPADQVFKAIEQKRKKA